MKTGVLVTGYGGPDSLDAIGPFMTNLMGKEPSPELLERVTRRYLAIGGASPLNEIARKIAEAINEALVESGTSVPVAMGMAYWDPYIGGALRALKNEGCDRVLAVSLSAFESRIAHGTYRRHMEEAAREIGGLEIVEVPLVSEFDEYSLFFASSVAVALQDIEPNEGIILVFSAHSLPHGDLVDDDPYISGLRRVANSVALKLGLSEGADAASPLLGGLETFGSSEPPRPWFLAYQSKGNRPGEWLGPDLDDIIEAVAGTEVKGMVVCPIGFMTDHMETMYDLDIAAAGKALDADLEFVRAPVPNEHPMVIDAIAKKIIDMI